MPVRDDKIIFTADIDAGLWNKKLEEMAKSLDLAAARELNLQQKMEGLDKTIKQQTIDFQGLSNQITQLNSKIAALQNQQLSASQSIGNFANRTNAAAGTVGRFGGAIQGLLGGMTAVFGIGMLRLAIPAIISFIKYIIDANKTLSEFEKRQKIVSEINEKASASIAAASTHLELYRQKLNDTNISQEKRIQLAKQYNKTAEDTNKIDLTQIDNIAEINRSINRQIEHIKRRALARAAETVVTQKADNVLKAEEAAREEGLKKAAVYIDNLDRELTRKRRLGLPVAAKSTLSLEDAAKGIIASDPAVIKAREELNRALSVAGGLIDIDALLTGDPDPEKKKTKEKVKKAIKEVIEKAVKTTLFSEMAKLSQDLTDFNVSNIRDDFTRQEAEINRQYDKQADFIISKQQQIFTEIERLKKTGKFSKLQLSIYSALSDDLIGGLSAANEGRKQNALLDLNFKKFLASLSDMENAADETDVTIAEGAAKQIQFNKGLYEAGLINLKEFQDSVTSIIKQAAADRKVIRIKELQEQLALLNTQIDGTKDPEQKKTLKSKQLGIRKQIAALESDIDKASPVEKDDRMKRVVEYADAIGDLTNQVIAFWQKTNEAEQRALDRSIRLQETRVEAARRVAERGNAEYLQMEEERLRELQLKRENAARRELAINAVLQTSQALVAFTGALASGIASGGALGGIAIAAAVIGLLASGYAIVKSLQQQQPTFFKGTKYLDRRGNRAGRDTIPALLNEGEAIIPTDTNRDYADSVAAIYDRRVPARDLNRFVNMYSRQGVAPVDYDRLDNANNFFIGQDGRLHAAMQEHTRKVDEGNQLMKSVRDGLKKIGVSVTLDRNGFAVSLMQAMKQFNIDKNT